jgi:hypothetical protein
MQLGPRKTIKIKKLKYIFNVMIKMNKEKREGTLQCLTSRLLETKNTTRIIKTRLFKATDIRKAQPPKIVQRHNKPLHSGNNNTRKTKRREVTT